MCKVIACFRRSVSETNSKCCDSSGGVKKPREAWVGSKPFPFPPFSLHHYYRPPNLTITFRKCMLTVIME